MSSKHKSHGPKPHGSSSKHGSSSTPRTSFLFICNELPTNDNPEHQDAIQARYVDGRWRPPREIRGFFQQVPGWVYRWEDGVVSVASDYAWSSRDTISGTADGRIYNAAVNFFPDYYRAATVFYCNRFDLFFTARGDASMKNMDQADPEDDWHPLTFSHNHHISRLEHAGDEEHLDVRAASWIDQLLPNNYRRSSSSHDAVHKGLGGMLPIAVSLIAFSCGNREELHRVLMEDAAWYGKVWRRHSRETGREARRGMVTTIYLDPENPQGSTRDTLFDLEFGRAPIFR